MEHEELWDAIFELREAIRKDRARIGTLEREVERLGTRDEPDAALSQLEWLRKNYQYPEA